MKLVTLAVVTAALALPAVAGAQNCNVGGCNLVVTAKGSGTWVTASTPIVFHPWTVDIADGHSDYTREYWSQFGGPVGRFSKYLTRWAGSNDYRCLAVTPGASTPFVLQVRAPAGRKFACHIHVT